MVLRLDSPAGTRVAAGLSPASSRRRCLGLQVRVEGCRAERVEARLASCRTDLGWVATSAPTVRLPDSMGASPCRSAPATREGTHRSANALECSVLWRKLAAPTWGGCPPPPTAPTHHSTSTAEPTFGLFMRNPLLRGREAARRGCATWTRGARRSSNAIESGQAPCLSHGPTAGPRAV